MFREEQAELIGDIQVMFHLLKVPKDEYSFLKFL